MHYVASETSVASIRAATRHIQISYSCKRCECFRMCRTQLFSNGLNFIQARCEQHRLCIVPKSFRMLSHRIQKTKCNGNHVFYRCTHLHPNNIKTGIHLHPLRAQQFPHPNGRHRILARCNKSGHLSLRYLLCMAWTRNIHELPVRPRRQQRTQRIGN